MQGSARRASVEVAVAVGGNQFVTEARFADVPSEELRAIMWRSPSLQRIAFNGRSMSREADGLVVRPAVRRGDSVRVLDMDGDWEVARVLGDDVELRGPIDQLVFAGPGYLAWEEVNAAEARGQSNTITQDAKGSARTQEAGTMSDEESRLGDSWLMVEDVDQVSGEQGRESPSSHCSSSFFDVPHEDMEAGLERTCESPTRSCPGSEQWASSDNSSRDGGRSGPAPDVEAGGAPSSVDRVHAPAPSYADSGGRQRRATRAEGAGAETGADEEGRPAGADATASGQGAARGREERPPPEPPSLAGRGAQSPAAAGHCPADKGPVVPRTLMLHWLRRAIASPVLRTLLTHMVAFAFGWLCCSQLSSRPADGAAAHPPARQGSSWHTPSSSSSGVRGGGRMLQVVFAYA